MSLPLKTKASLLGVTITAEGAAQIKLLNDLLQNKGLIKEGVIDYCNVHKLKCDVL